MLHSLRDELTYLFSGQGMPYAKISLIVSLACALLFTAFLGNNTIHNGAVAVIDLDRSAYSRSLIEKMDASPFIRIKEVTYTPAKPETFLYNDACIAVVYIPQQLEKSRYGRQTGTIGVFYDNTSLAQSGEIKNALNEIIAAENISLSVQGVSRQTQGLSLSTRLLFNPAGSGANNGSVQGFLFFFSSMFFVFATIGIVPRLRLMGKLDGILQNGTPWHLLIRLVPYGMCLLTALVIGMVVLHYLNDMHVAGNIVFFYITQFLYIFALGMLSLLFGWNAANPGIASSRMILFIPGGFILGGTTAPVQELSAWARMVSHIFPLTWEFEFTRDILVRGAGIADMAATLGAFLLYIAILMVLFHVVFYRARRRVPGTAKGAV